VEINQVYKAPSLPKIGRRNINSSLNRGALGSGITAKKSTFSFNKVAPKLTSAKLNTDTDKSKESFNSIKPFKSNLDIVDVLKESNKLLYEIREQLSLDYNERIKEREENLRLAKKRITANKISEKEKKIESRGKSLIGSALNTVIAPAKSIFQRILDFLSIIITGIVLNTAFNWLSKKENQEKLEKFFNFLGDYWKELLVVFGAFKILRLVQKIFKIGKGLKSLFNGFKGRGGGNTSPKLPGGGGCGPVTGKGGCLDQLSSTSETAKNLTQTLFATAFATNYFKRFAPAKQKNEAEQQAEETKELTPLEKIRRKAIPAEVQEYVSPLLQKYFSDLTIFGKTKTQSVQTPMGQLIVEPTSTNVFTGDQTPKFRFISKEEQDYKAQQTQLILDNPWIKTFFGAQTVLDYAGMVMAGRTGMGAKSKSPFIGLKSMNLSKFRTSIKNRLGQLKPKLPRRQVDRLVEASAKEAQSPAFHRSIGEKTKDGKLVVEENVILDEAIRRSVQRVLSGTSGTSKERKNLEQFRQTLEKTYANSPKLEPETQLRSMGGTIFGKGSQTVDSVPAMLAPGEEVIKTSSANLFRPLLKDINDNAGRLWRQFTEATIIQDKNNKKSEKMNLVFRKLLTEFTELFDKEKREIEKRKRKARRRQPVGPPGGGSPGLSSSRKSPPTSSGKISNSKNTSSPMSTMRSSGKIPNPKNTSSPTSPSSLRNTNKVTPQISSTPQSVNKMSNKTQLQAVKIVPFPINNSEKQLESNISTPTPTINIQNIKNSPTTMSVGPLVIEKNSGAPSVNVVNLAPKVLDLSKKSTPKPSVTDSDAAPIPSISPFDSNNDFNYTVPETLGILV
jgi:hypothetical protein